jgi:hypothetical protein
VYGNATPASSIPPLLAGTPASTTVSDASVANPGTTPSVIPSLPGCPATFSVPPLTGLEKNSAGGTNNLVPQILSSNWTSHVPAATTTGGNAINEGFTSIDGTFYRHINANTAQYDISNHATSPLPALSYMEWKMGA